MSVQDRIEAAERELAAAKAELAALPKFEPDALYIIDNDGPKFLAYGRDLQPNPSGLRATRFAYVESAKGAGHVPTFKTGGPLPGKFSPEATVTKVNL